ncbi:MAG: metal ABC transporter solute-binding protein, Zn/Mn family [Turicibacter sp.]
MKKYYLILLCLFLTACSTTNPQTDKQTTIEVATTLYPITYFVERIGGDAVTILPIIENGADAHSYEPTIKQMKSAADAHLLFYIDSSVETFMPKLLPNMKTAAVKIVPIAQNMTYPKHFDIGESISLESGTLTTDQVQNEKTVTDPNHATDEDHDHETLNNHIWLYPPLAISMAQTILTELKLLKPELASVFTQNYEALEKDLLALDTAFNELKNAPKPYFMVTHAAYSTWKYYGIQQIPITGILGNDEPTQKELIELIELGKNLDLNYLFYEQNIPSSNGEVLQKELNLTPTKLYNLATITNEELKAGKDYFSLMYENLENLKAELYPE